MCHNSLDSVWHGCSLSHLNKPWVIREREPQQTHVHFSSPRQEKSLWRILIFEVTYHSLPCKSFCAAIFSTRPHILCATKCCHVVVIFHSLLTVHKSVRQPATLPTVPLWRNHSKRPLLNDNKCQALTLTHSARIHQTSHHLPGTRLWGGERVLQAEPANFLHTSTSKWHWVPLPPYKRLYELQNLGGGVCRPDSAWLCLPNPGRQQAGRQQCLNLVALLFLCLLLK